MSRVGCRGTTGVLAFLLLFTGCAPSFFTVSTPEPPAPEVHLIPHVPFFPQEALQCGPASLAAVLDFWGGDLQPEEISGRVYSARLGGTLPMDLEAEAERFGRDRGLKVRIHRDDPGIFREELAAGRPLLVFVDLGFWVWRKGHFMVLVGHDDRRGGVLAHSGREREVFIPYGTFLARWDRTGYWALLIMPETGGDATRE